MCSLHVELLEMPLINSTQERGTGWGSIGGREKNDVHQECVDFGKRTLIKEYQT